MSAENEKSQSVKMKAGKTTMGKLVTVGLVLVLLVFLLSILMPALQTARKAAVKTRLASELYEEDLEMRTGSYVQPRHKPKDEDKETMPAAVVEEFDAQINLTPKVSVGTAVPESIYEADFSATIQAKSSDEGVKECQIELPLPPQVISLADVDVTVNGVASEDFVLGWNSLIWQGPLDNEKFSQIKVTYSAVGKGVYRLEKPSGRIIDKFKAKLTAHRGNIRMLELSLQPNNLEQEANKTTYTWEYNRLVVARPIVVDVLGMAAIDRLGELTWLGPLSVFVFGILIALTALAYDPEKLSGWVVVLVAGCFAGAYPMMYFLQDFASLAVAIGVAVAIVTVIIACRIISLCGLGYGIFGGLVLPAVMFGLTLATAIATNRAMQGVLLTGMAIFAFVVAMVLLPKAQEKLKAEAAEG
jgi:hypothetical protein